MKTMKKLASVVLALILTLALAAPAFAANGDGKITVSNPAPGQTYKLYRIFDLAYGGTTDGDENAPHTYTVNADWADFIDQGAIKGVYVSVDDQGYVTWIENADVEAFAAAAILWAEGKEAVPEVKDDEGNVITAAVPAEPGRIDTPVASTTAGTADEPTAGNPDPRAEAITFEDLPLGYYLISSTRGALCALDTTNKSVSVQEKNVKPTVEKKAVEMPEGLGSNVGYEVTIHAKKGAEKYVLHDTMSKGLKFNNDVVVKVGETVVASSNYTVTTATTDGCTFEVIFTQTYLDTLTAENTNIVISYSAEVTADALVIDTVNNTASLSYGNEKTPEETLPDVVETPLYSFDLVKTNSDQMGKRVLAGAEFELYNVAKDGEAIKLVFVPAQTESKTEGEGDDAVTTKIEVPAYYRPATSEDAEDDITTTITSTTDKVTIKGLGEGTFYLEETKAPEGYNLVKGRTSVEVGEGKNWTATVTPETTTGEGDDAVTTPATYVEGGVRVINLTGAELPSTGGIGTTIFYIVGGALAVGACILLVTKKRVGAKEE